jgi:sRNA-binding regulator protein Hfq
LGDIMRNRDLVVWRTLGRVAVFLFALAMLVLTFAASAFAQTSADQGAPTPPPATVQPSQQQLENWRKNMPAQPPRLGCFTSAYPSNQWQEVPCTTAPAVPFPPARGPRPDTVGNGYDVSAQVSGHISEAVGSFDSVTGVTSESGTGTFGGPNAFTLQLNSNFFASPACSGAANPSNCLGWQQFVYANVSCPHCAFIQYWLINYNATCPSGWTASGGDCFTNSAAVNVPAQTITNLGNLSLTGQVNSGGNDIFIMAVGINVYSVQGVDTVVFLAQGWQDAEFNVVGDCCGSQANFNTGSTIVVRTSVNSGTLNAPSCLGQGFTGETNNLSFAAPPAAIHGTFPAILFTENSAGGAPSACASATGVAGTQTKLAQTHDFNDDGKSDIAWRNTNGDVAIWLMNGTQTLSASDIGNVPTSWSIVGQRQLNNSGYADLIWRNTNGDVAIWLMNGTQTLSASDIGNMPTSWSIAGTSAYNATNGYAELIWRNTDGDVAIWQMNGTQVLSSPDLGNVPTSWSIVGTGDFSGTGNTDILWLDTAGDVAIWFMNGTQVVSTPVLGNVPISWTIVGTGDFNGDGKTDILWRNANGDVAIWLMNGTQVVSGLDLGNVPASWTIAETGDFNSDGYSDILWRDTAGDVAIWFMNGTQVVSAQVIGNVPMSWTIQGANAD